MTREAIRQVVESSAKFPVTLRLTDGRSVRIAHPDYAMFPVTATREFVVTQPETPFRFEIIATHEVASAILDRTPAKPQ